MLSDVNTNLKGTAMRNIAIEGTMLADYVMSPAVYQALNPVRRTANQSHEPIRFTVDCGPVTWFTSEALAVLAKARRELGYLGHQLVLINYSAEIAHDMLVPLFCELLEGWPLAGSKSNPATHRPIRQLQAA